MQREWLIFQGEGPKERRAVVKHRAMQINKQELVWRKEAARGLEMEGHSMRKSQS